MSEERFSCGHTKTVFNTYIDPRGWAQCRECRTRAVQRHRARVKAELAEYKDLQRAVAAGRLKIVADFGGDDQ